MLQAIPTNMRQSLISGGAVGRATLLRKTSPWKSTRAKPVSTTAQASTTPRIAAQVSTTATLAAAQNN